MSDLVGQELARRTSEHLACLRSQMCFGEEWTETATHEERIARWNELLRHEWHRRGGAGPHPMEELRAEITVRHIERPTGRKT